MLVVFFVTGDAGHGRVLEDRAFVAGLALDVVMLAAQREAGYAMVKPRFFPAALDVAIATLLAQRILVLVVFLVARHTGRLQLVTVRVASVAIGATGLPVLAAQPVFRVAVVVEQNAIPRLGVVAGLTFFAKAAFVLVVCSVTRHARHGRVLEDIALVAILALRFGVLVFKFEIRRVMVELRFFPVELGMAVRALRAQLALVLVVLPVARNAGALRAAVRLACCVTFAAFRFRVLTLEQVIRQLVVKFLFVQHDNPCVTSFVLCMAGSAGLLLDAPVIALPLRYVLTHVLVAVTASLVLSFAVKANVARFAFVFGFGMATNDLARHQHAFQRLRPCRLESQPCRQPG